MRQVFTIRFQGDSQTAQTIVVTSKKGLIPVYIEEYRGDKGSEIWFKSHNLAEIEQPVTAEKGE